MTGAIDAARFRERLASVRDRINAAGIDAVLVGVGADLEWLVGYAAQGHERLNLLLVRSNGGAVFISPRLELKAAEQAPGLGGGDVELISWMDTEDPMTLVAQQLASSQATARYAVSDGLRSAFLLGLQRTLDGAEFEIASTTLAPLRAIKDADEIELLRIAAAAADRVIEQVAHGPLIGRSEADVAREVRERLLVEGHDTAEFAIVAGGPNSASPHHEPADRLISIGEPVLFDIGGRRGGYCSDTTRTFWVAGEANREPDPDFVEIYTVTERAHAAARDAVRPGVKFEDLDATARSVIDTAGFADQFLHRLGHGIGLEVHEVPYLVSGNAEAAGVGTTFSIEPGIYLEGRYGVRIEDIVVCTLNGADALNDTPRGLRSVSGL